MSVPGPWQFALLALGTYRVWRLAAIDDMPWLVRGRNWAVGAEELAGVWTFRRPTLAHMISCPWCLGWWSSLAAVALWWLAPHAALLIAVPFAVAAAVGAFGHLLNP